jgi:predicted DNA-binding transcriptional regulator AlpA
MIAKKQKAESEEFRLLSYEECALKMGVSLRTFFRLIKNDGPKITRLSERMHRVRSDHLQQWLDVRAEASEAA